MNKYFIKEYDSEMTLIELRVCAFLCCEGRIKKITEILNYLNANGFITNLVLMYDDSIRAENIDEFDAVQSLTIDIRNDKFRFKYWNGNEILWLFHTQDLFQSLISNEKNYFKISKKYQPITDILYDIQNNFTTILKDIRYNYYPNDDNEVVYHLVFFKDAEETHLEHIVLKEFNERVQQLDEDLKQELKFVINFDFDKKSECSTCEQARLEREKNATQKNNAISE